MGPPEYDEQEQEAKMSHTNLGINRPKNIMAGHNIGNVLAQGTPQLNPIKDFLD